MIKRVLLAILSILSGMWLLRRLGLKETVDWRDAEKPGRVVDINGYGVHIVERGSGPRVMLLIHGFGAGTFSWRELIPHFERDFRIVAVDLKGYGYSERDADAGLSASDQVTMLKALLDRLGIERVVVAGHSMGGGIAQRFAAAHPEMVEAIILAASVTGDEGVGRPRPPAWLVRPFAPLIGALTASRLLRLCYYDKSYLTPEVRAGYMGPFRVRGSLDGMLAMMRDTAADPPIDSARITAPVLLLYGAHDRVVPLKSGQRIRERVPHARLVVVDRAAHNFIEERHEECAAAIREFLAESVPAREAAAGV